MWPWLLRFYWWEINDLQSGLTGSNKSWGIYSIHAHTYTHSSSPLRAYWISFLSKWSSFRAKMVTFSLKTLEMTTFTSWHPFIQGHMWNICYFMQLSEITEVYLKMSCFCSAWSLFFQWCHMRTQTCATFLQRFFSKLESPRFFLKSSYRNGKELKYSNNQVVHLIKAV